jgi:uncharacterized protein
VTPVLGAFILSLCALPLVCAFGAYETPLALKGQPFEVAVASTPEALEKGLMEVTDLAPNQGMLFLFGKKRPAVFWMKNTPSNLDLAYLDQEGHILQIESLKAYSLKKVPSRMPAWAALELPAGTFARAKARVGDKVVCPALAPKIMSNKHPQGD